MALTSIDGTEDGLTPSQEERRARILASAAELAAEGGWDTVQMREVATRSDVALGTLIATSSRNSCWCRDLRDRGARRSPAVRPPRKRPCREVVDVLRRLTGLCCVSTGHRRHDPRPGLGRGHRGCRTTIRSLMRRIISDNSRRHRLTTDDDRRTSLALRRVVRLLVSWISGVRPPMTWSPNSSAPHAPCSADWRVATPGPAQGRRATV